MQDLKELKAAEINAAYANDRGYSGAFSAGFRLGIETAMEYPERTIKKNKSIINRLKEVFKKEQSVEEYQSA